MSRSICKKGLVLLLFPYRTYVFGYLLESFCAHFVKVSRLSNCHYNEFCRCIECRYKEGCLYSKFSDTLIPYLTWSTLLKNI